jgi:hypothetical protein
MARYNPPPNWPSPPQGWVPPPDWKPNPAWPEPPPDWEFWVDDSPDAPAEKQASFPDVAAEHVAPQSPPEVAPDQLSADHLGCRAMARWDDERRYKIGTITDIIADVSEVIVHFAGGASVSFVREQPKRGPANPRLYVWGPTRH